MRQTEKDKALIRWADYRSEATMHLPALTGLTQFKSDTNKSWQEKSHRRKC